MSKQKFKPYEKINLRFNENEQVCNTNLIFKELKICQTKNLCKEYQL